MIRRNHVTESWSNVDTELNRRYDLIPNLLKIVKGYAAHERETLRRVSELRNICKADHGSIRHQEDTEKQLVAAMRTLFAVVEAYPRADSTMATYVTIQFCTRASRPNSLPACLVLLFSTIAMLILQCAAPPPSVDRLKMTALSGCAKVLLE